MDFAEKEVDDDGEDPEEDVVGEGFVCASSSARHAGLDCARVRVSLRHAYGLVSADYRDAWHESTCRFGDSGDWSLFGCESAL